MRGRWSRVAAAGIVLPVTIAGAVLAYAQTQALPPSPSARPEGRSPDVRARLLDGRMAMVRESLRLNEAQMKLWAPVEAQLRASYEARQKGRAERRAWRHSGERDRAALPDRLDRASQRATERAERAKALAEAFRPFYASLTDDQKAVASVVMRRALRSPPGRRTFMRHAAGEPR